MEACKRILTDSLELQASVDWLTEVIRRFSKAALAARPFSAVSMKNPLRAYKVSVAQGRVCSVELKVSLYHRHLEKKKWSKEEAPYRDEDWTREEMITFEDAIIHHNAELRAVRDEVVTRTMPDVIRSSGH